MMTRFRKQLLVIGLGFAACSSHAVTFHVIWDIGSLSLPSATNPTNLTYLDLQLTDGANIGNGNSLVRIENLNLTGGTWDSPLSDIGNVSVAPNGDIWLKDGDGAGNEVSDHAIGFHTTSSSAVLSFYFSVTQTGFDTPIPDYFNVSLLDNDISAVGTVGPAGREFVGYDLVDDPHRVPVVYGVDPAWARVRGDKRFDGLSAPRIEVVPEPASCFAAVAGLGMLLRRRRRG